MTPPGSFPNGAIQGQHLCQVRGLVSAILVHQFWAEPVNGTGLLPCPLRIHQARRWALAVNTQVYETEPCDVSHILHGSLTDNSWYWVIQWFLTTYQTGLNPFHPSLQWRWVFLLVLRLRTPAGEGAINLNSFKSSAPALSIHLQELP